jgi:hypothetical protein
MCTREASQLKSISKVNTGPKARTSLIVFHKSSKFFDFVEWAHETFRASHLYSVFVRLDEMRLPQNFTGVFEILVYIIFAVYLHTLTRVHYFDV